MLARRIFLPSSPIIFNTIYNSTEEILYIYIYFFIFEYKLFPFPKFSGKFARSSRYTIRDVNINTNSMPARPAALDYCHATPGILK